jgi:hypothetical protein
MRPNAEVPCNMFVFALNLLKPHVSVPFIPWPTLLRPLWMTVHPMAFILHRFLTSWLKIHSGWATFDNAHGSWMTVYVLQLLVFRSH